MNLIKLFLLLSIVTFSYAKTIFLEKNVDYQEILSKSQIYIDHSRSLTIDDINNKKVEFKDNNKSILGFGYSPDFDVWIRFTLKNNTNEKLEQIVEYDNSLTTDIEFYEDKNLFTKEGSFNISEDRKTLTPTFHIELAPNEEKTYFIKASSYVTTLIIKLELWDFDNFYEKEIIHQLILALFFGGMFILALYNLSLFFFTKEISYLFYVMYIFGIIFHQLVYVGMGTLYLFSKEVFFIIIDYASFLVAFPAFALALFTKSFLNTRQYKILDYILKIFLFLVPFLAILFVLTDGYDRYRNLLAIVLFIYLLFITIYASIKKNKQAYFILFGWTVVLVASILMYLSSSGIFNVFESFPYIIEFAFISEAVIFSIALAYRIKQLQKEKNDINNKLILQQKEEGKRLKIQVEEKTKDLKEALNEKGLLLREVHHRVKNNMQLILSLIDLQSDEIEDEKVKGVFTTVQNRIYAMSELHELLYREDVNILKIDAYEYFDKIIDELRQSYDSEDIDIRFDIQTKVEISQAIYCGLILNELVTNSMKYAFKENAGYILISLKIIDEKYIFHIEDNGVGFKNPQNSDSLGLLLVDTLVKRQLKGDLKFDTKDGVKVDIMWSKDDNKN